eukprot:scaffold20199_cov33-Phaeocystis_antarctica.AAC.2
MCPTQPRNDTDDTQNLRKAPLYREKASGRSVVCLFSRLRRPIRLEPSRSHSAHRALSYREGGECWHVRPRMLYVIDEARVGA